MKPGNLFNIIFLIAIFCFAGMDSKAQQPSPDFKPDQYRAINWTMDDGLSPGEHYMIKDGNGFLWFGALRGLLFRFDGAHIEKYPPDQGKPQSGFPGGINSFVEDSLKNIWIGTYTGLFRYDMKADSFTHFTAETDSVNKDRSIIPFWCTQNNLYCLEPGSRIVLYNIHTLKKTYLLTLTEKEINDIIQPNQTIIDTLSNSLWMLEGGNGDPDHPGGGLFQVSLKDGKRSHYGWSCYRNIPKHDHGSEAMRFDSRRNSIWINSDDGLMEFSLSDKKFHFTEAFKELIKLKDYGRFVGLDIDREGRIWLATHPKGILIYDPGTKQVKQLFSDPDLQQKTGGNNLQIYCDRDGIIWASFWDNRGIYELLPYKPCVTLYPAKPKVRDSLSDSRIGWIMPADHGQIWIGTQTGINNFHSNTGKFELVINKDLPGIKGNPTIPIFVDTIQQKAWLSNVNGDRVIEMDLITRKCNAVKFRDGPKQFDTINIESQFAQPYKSGLLVYDQNHGFFEIKKDSPFADLVIPFKDWMGRIVLEDDRILFLKNPYFPPNYSFENINGNWKKSTHLVDSLDWISLYYNKKDQTNWVSLDNELVHYDKNFRKIKSYSGKEGYREGVFNMLTDDHGNLWFVNNRKELGRLNIRTGLITNLSAADGFQAQNFDWITPAARDIQGNLYFGESALGTGKTGLIRINPEKYTSSGPSFVYFNTLSVNFKKFPLSNGINNIEFLNLQHDQNSISIETGIIDYYSLGKSHLRYKLEGGERTEDWQYGPAYYTIRYEGLEPGHYRLVLQASNAGNEFNGPEKILQIIINPPWWQTWWARLSFVSAFIFLLWSFIQYRSRNLKQRNAVLEEKVMLRTKELKRSLEDLRTTQDQLIQREKMASLGELTAGIAHEIQNPLNFVNNFSEINAELIDEMNAEIKSGHLEEAALVAKDVKENNLKITHHGKRADSIVKGMLQHSRSSTGQKELTNINDLADEYLRLSYHGLRANDKSFNATMITDFDKNIDKIYIIPQDIGRVFLNLFNNSFYSVNEKKKMLPSGFEPTIWVSTRKRGSQVEIKIKDNGTGIPRKLMDKIFQPFFTTKPTGQGTGLGLSLSYDIITKGHGGELKVNSTEGEYVEFTMILPV